jgi:WD40 repeat protein
LLLRPEDGREVDHLNLPASGTPIALLSPDGDFLAASGQRFGTQIFDAITRRRLAADPAPAWHLQFDASGACLGTLLDQGRPLWLEWQAPVVQTTWRSPGQLDQNERISFSRDGRRLASLIGGGVVLWDLASGKFLKEINLPEVRSVEFGPDPNQLYCITGTSLFSVDLSLHIEKKDIIPHRLLTADNLKGLAVANNGTIALAEFGRSSIIILSGTNREEIPLPIQPLTIACSPDAHWLACGSYFANDICLVDLKQPVASPARLVGAGSSAGFSTDGKTLFTFGGGVRAWRVGDWRALTSPAPQARSADPIIGAVSHDGRWLAAAQHDREVILVELASGRTIANLNGPGEGSILALAFSPDGNTLVIARDRGDIQIWPLPRLNAELAKLGLNW